MTPFTITASSLASSLPSEPYAAQVAVAGVVFSSLSPIGISPYDELTPEQNEKLTNLLSSLDIPAPKHTPEKKLLKRAENACTDALSGARPCGNVTNFKRLPPPDSPLDFGFDNTREEKTESDRRKTAASASAIVGNLAFFKN